MSFRIRDTTTVAFEEAQAQQVTEPVKKKGRKGKKSNKKEKKSTTPPPHPVKKSSGFQMKQDFTNQPDFF